MDYRSRILKKSSAKVVFLMIVLVVIISMQNASNDLTQICTKSTFSTCGRYNPLSEKLLYCGIMVDDGGKINSLNISVKDFINDTEIIIEENIINPPIGWIDSSRVLIYKVNTSQHGSGWNFTKNLYSIDIHSQVQEQINLPLDSIFNPFEDIVVNNKSLIYKKGYSHNNSLKYIKLDMDLNNQEEIELLRNIDVGNLIYHKDQDILVYTLTNENGSELVYLRNDEQKSIVTSNTYFEHLSLTPSGEILYFIVANGSEYEYQQVLKSYNIEKNKLIEHYFFDENEECLGISAYKEDEVIISLGFESKISSEHTIPIAELDFDVGLNPTSNLYIYSVN